MKDIMTKHKALRLIEGILKSIDPQELETALQKQGLTQKDLSEALVFISWLESSEDMGR